MLISLNQLVTKTKKLNFYVFIFVAIQKEESQAVTFPFFRDNNQKSKQRNLVFAFQSLADAM